MSEAPRTPYDDMPIEVRRASWGWFGDPWPSGVCYDDDGRLREEMHKPFPAGETCLYCAEPFDEAAGDAGQAMPFQPASGPPAVRHVHKECLLREVLGPIAHLEGRCGQTRAQAARRIALDALADDHLALERHTGHARDRARARKAEE